MPAAWTVPPASLMVIVPAAPPLPIIATSPFTHGRSAAPLDQLASVVVFQLPLPSFGVTGLVGLASHVTLAACIQVVHSGAAAKTATAAISLLRRGRREGFAAPDPVLQDEFPSPICRRTLFALRIAHSPLP